MSEYHTPIMVKEVLKGLQVAPGRLYIDATVGGGGHAREIVKQGGVLLGIDADREAIEEARISIRYHVSSIKKENADWKLVQGNFRDIENIAKREGFDKVDGILFDLGVSSHQLDEEGRGFSYRFPAAPLDLRLNQGEAITAAQYLQKVTEQELYEILATFGEEEHSRAISIAISRARAVRPIDTTGALLTIIENVVGAKDAKTVASRVFQALRIVVNDERNALKEGLKGAKELLMPGGRLAVISFHSLEDRMVKLYFKTDAWKLITKKPIVAGEKEIQRNKRSRSAKLRIAEKL